MIDPQPGEPTHVTIATTRPETMLGDTAVAVHPDPAKALARAAADLQQRLAAAPAKEKAAIGGQLEEVQRRTREMLPQLEQLRDMAARRTHAAAAAARTRNPARRRSVGQAGTGQRLREGHARPRCQ